MSKYFTNYFARHSLLLKKTLEKLQDYYLFDAKKLRELSNELFMKQFNYAFKNSSFYHNLYSQYGLNINSIKSLDDITLIPVIQKKDIKYNIHDIYTGLKLFYSKGQTSGTTGSPLTVYRDYNSILLENAYQWHYRIRKGYQPRDRAISLSGKLLKDQLKSFDPYLNILYLSGYNINADEIGFYIKEIEKFKPKAVIGYPSSLSALAVEISKKAVLSVKIPLAFTSSENLYDFQTEKIEKVFNCRVHDWYGNAERTIALEQCDAGGYHEAPLYSYNEFEENRIITTGFINKHFPLIRYQVDDLISLDDHGQHICNMHTRKIKSIDGRAQDYVVLCDGSIVNRLNQAFKNIRNVQFIQLIQNDCSKIFVNVVPEIGFNLEDHDQIFDSIYSRSGESIKLEVNTIEEKDIVRSDSGKYLLVVNNLKKNGKASAQRQALNWDPPLK